MTLCSCDESAFASGVGRCERHDCDKTLRYFQLCKHYQAYWEAYERGEGPCLGRYTVEYCEPQPEDDGKTFVCRKCGKRRSGRKSQAYLAATRCPGKYNDAQQESLRAVQAASPSRGCCGGTQQLKAPGLVRRALGFARSVVDFAADGFQLVTPDVEHERGKICTGCAQFDDNWCRACGCYLPIARKLRSKHCPLAMWPSDAVNDWTPSVTEEWLRKLVVVVPHLDAGPLLENCRRDCLREPVAFHAEHGPDGWLKACNRGLRQVLAAPEAYEYFVLLNDDVRLSRGFFAGLVLAHTQTGSDIISACYNVGWQPQKPTHCEQPEADAYPARPVHRRTGIVDGTCALVTRRVLEECGFLDEERFGGFGWSAVSDLCIRAKQRGMTVSVTEASYCYHLNMQTAKKVHGRDYVARAITEAQKGMREKWGDSYDVLQNAETLPRGTALPAITVRNIVYHAYSRGDRAWWNVTHLLGRVDQIFNGKRVACVTTDGSNAHERVVEAFQQKNFTVILRRNDARLRDSAAFLDMLGFVQSIACNEATFVGHTKGATSRADSRWAEQMYACNLDNWHDMMSALRTHSVAGTLRRVVAVPHISGQWHYAGSFYWFRHDSLFNKDWRSRQAHPYLIEEFPGAFFPIEESYNACDDFAQASWVNAP